MRLSTPKEVKRTEDGAVLVLGSRSGDAHAHMHGVGVVGSRAELTQGREFAPQAVIVSL